MTSIRGAQRHSLIYTNTETNQYRMEEKYTVSMFSGKKKKKKKRNLK